MINLNNNNYSSLINDDAAKKALDGICKSPLGRAFDLSPASPAGSLFIKHLTDFYVAIYRNNKNNNNTITEDYVTQVGRFLAHCNKRILKDQKKQRQAVQNARPALRKMRKTEATKPSHPQTSRPSVKNIVARLFSGAQPAETQSDQAKGNKRNALT